MSDPAHERIHHYNRLLVEEHRYLGGTILQGYGLRTRIFAWRERKTLRAWGADYTPGLGNLKWVDRLFFRYGHDDEIGVPGTLASDAWFSVARRASVTATRITQYDYDSGARRLGPPYVAIGEHILAVPFDEITVDQIRAGFGSSRELPLPPTNITHDPVHAERLANSLQSAAAYIIQHGGDQLRIQSE